MIEQKIGICIKKYGDIAFKHLPKENNDDCAWRVIYDLSMFAKGIYFTLSENERLGGEEYDLVVTYLKYFLKEDSQKRIFEIINCPHYEVDYRLEPYLRLCFIAFVADFDSLPLIKAFLELKYLFEIKSQEFEFQDDALSPEEKSNCLLILNTEDWKQKILSLYEKYSGQTFSGESSQLGRKCNQILLFVRNTVTDDPHRF